MTDGGNNSCSRCGICCRAGGPALHYADRHLVEEGKLRLTELYTIRRGEIVRDNVQNRIVPVPGDVIKIKGRSGGAVCLFYDTAESTCRIYSHRPQECRILKCWDTDAIRGCYDRDRLSREDFLKGRHDCWDLVAAHQQTCGYEIIPDLIKRDDHEQLAYMIRYDAQIRRLVVKRIGLNAGLLDFLFGLPLSVTIERYGIKAVDIGAR